MISKLRCKKLQGGNQNQHVHPSTLRLRGDPELAEAIDTYVVLLCFPQRLLRWFKEVEITRHQRAQLPKLLYLPLPLQRLPNLLYLPLQRLPNLLYLQLQQLPNLPTAAVEVHCFAHSFRDDGAAIVSLSLLIL